MSYTPTLQEIIGGVGADKIKRVPFQRAGGLNALANRPNSYWSTQGMSGTGTFGATGKANGRLLTAATVGALVPVIPANANFIGFELQTETSASAAATFFLLDRISDIQLLHTETTGAIVGLDATPASLLRLPAGAGCQLFGETTVGGNAANTVFNLGYTNQDNVPGRFTPDITVTASNLACRSISDNRFWLPLQDGDVGVRSVQSYNHVSGAETGSMSIALCRVIETLTSSSAGTGGTREQMACPWPLQPIDVNTCFAIVQQNMATAGTGTLVGDLIFLVD